MNFILKLIKLTFQIVAVGFYIIPALYCYFKGVDIKLLLLLMICWFIGMTLSFITFAFKPVRKKHKEEEFDI